MPDTTGLVTRTNFNTKVTEIENKVLNTSDLIKNTDLITLLQRLNIKY